MTIKQGSKRELKPKVRFPEFRNAPGWENEAMGEVYSFKGTNSFSRDQLNYESGTVKNIHYGDIHTKYPSLFDICKEKVPFINPSESLQTIHPDNYCIEGDVIFADASEDLEDVGKSIEIVALNDERLLSGMHTILARQKRKILIIGFGGHLFKSARIRNQIKKEAQGVKVFGVSPTRLSNIEICYPPEKAEQQKIATCLTSLDELIDSHGQKLDALKAHKRGLMRHLFPHEGETLPRLRFPEFQDSPEWISGSLGNIFETSSGGTPERSVKEYWNGKIPWITTSLVDFNVICNSDEFISEMGLKNSSAKLFEEKTVLVAMYGQGKTRGKVALLGIEATTNQACAAILPREDIDPYFVFLNLAGRYDEMRGLSNSGGQENLSQGLIKGLPFSYPNDIAEQQKISACLSSFDELITAQTETLEALKTHKKGLMQQLFPLPENTHDAS